MLTGSKKLGKTLAIFGRRECGKTELEIQLSYALAAKGLVFVSDMVGNWPSGYHYTLDGYYKAERIPRLVVFPTAEPEEVAEVAYHAGNCTVIFDEADLICDAHGWKSQEARNIIRRGRHYGISAILATQRPANIHSDVKALADKVAVFSLEHPNDLDAIEEWLGVDYREAVEQLPPHEFVLWPDRLICKMGLNSAPVQRPLT